LKKRMQSVKIKIAAKQQIAMEKRQKKIEEKNKKKKRADDIKLAKKKRTNDIKQAKEKAKVKNTQSNKPMQESKDRQGMEYGTRQATRVNPKSVKNKR